MTDTKIRVLLVDDHAIMREGLAAGLDSYGITVVGEAGDGATALQLFDALDPGCVHRRPANDADGRR